MSNVQKIFSDAAPIVYVCLSVFGVLSSVIFSLVILLIKMKNKELNERLYRISTDYEKCRKDLDEIEKIVYIQKGQHDK